MSRGDLGEMLAGLACAYEKLDAATLIRFYTEDSEWLDTLGRRVRGRAEIQVHVSQLFERGWIPGDTLRGLLA
jgi:ketosteroid isomerase-like protein